MAKKAKISHSIDEGFSQLDLFASMAGVSSFDLKQSLSNLRVLILGAGGLGCEILKNSVYLGFTNIDIIDMDTIDLTNLNRQFLFRQEDIGKFKATVAADKVRNTRPGLKITPHSCRLEDCGDDFYQQFHIVIGGLDSVEARRWINSKLHELVDPEIPESMKLFIDGGTEGMSGQVRIIKPWQTACFECSLGLLAKKVTYPLCTIATNPRLPEHCIQWAATIAWPQHNGNGPPDLDDPKDIAWLENQAKDRASEYNIDGVTTPLVSGVLKNIVPAVASTNAIVASMCCTEAMKLVLGVGDSSKTYMQYSGIVGAHFHGFELHKEANCMVCAVERALVELTQGTTLRSFLQHVQKSEAYPMIQLPSATCAGKSLYLRQPAALEASTRANLDKPLDTLLSKGNEILLTDAETRQALKVRVSFK